MRSGAFRSIIVGLVALAPAWAGAWQTVVTGTPGTSRPLALDVDGAGDVLTVGRIEAQGGNDGVVAKLGGADGAELWRRTVAGSAGTADQLSDVGHTSDGSVVATGQVTNLDGNGDAVVVKYDAGGTLAWRVDVDGGANGEDGGLAIAVDAADDVVVAGRTTAVSGGDTQFALWKRLGGDGTSGWQVALDGTPGTGSAVAIAGNDVFAAGDVADRIVVARVALATGAVAWRTDVAGSAVADDVARSVAVGGGRVVVAGRMTTANGSDFAVVALDPATGAELWRYVVDGSATGTADADEAFDVAVDAAGDVIAVGRISDAASDDDIAVVKLAAATGAELWRTIVKGGNQNADDAQAVAVDAAGNVSVVGGIRYANRRRDLFLGSFDGATGAERWRLEVNGAASDADNGTEVVLDAAGNPVAAGRLQNGAGTDGFVVLKRTGANGGDFPCANGVQDPGEACDDGNVTAGDGCRADCTVEVCGDGITDPQEQCDDGNTADGDCCDGSCGAEPDSQACDDGDACTLGDRCQGGYCLPANVVVCVPEGPCRFASCDPADGTCVSTPKAIGAPCDDGDACTVFDRCLDDVCTGSGAPSCDDGDTCTVDGCDPARGCAYEPRPGFGSVGCVLERGAVAAACGAVLPARVRRALDRIGAALDRGAATDRVGRARRALRRVEALAGRGRHAGFVLVRRGRLDAGCWGTLDAALEELAARASGLRERLVAAADGQ